MTRTTEEIEESLSAPGAGLPKIELWVAKWMVGRTVRKLDPSGAAQLIESVCAALMKIARETAPEDCARRVLIKRLPGLEDSSRYWSLYMTLDHLRIMNGVVAYTLGELSAGRVPPREGSTAAVKPRPDIGEEVVGEFQQSCDALAVAGKAIQSTSLRYAHPWFGPLDAHGWHVVAGFHMQLHHRQINRILGGLEA